MELTEPRKALDQAGADTQVVSAKDNWVRGWNFTDWDDDTAVDVALERAQPRDYDALLLAGGVDLPRPMGRYRDHRGARAADYLLAVA